MTDISRYKNVSLTKDTYQNLDKEIQRLNGKAKDKQK